MLYRLPVVDDAEFHFRRECDDRDLHGRIRIALLQCIAHEVAEQLMHTVGVPDPLHIAGEFKVDNATGMSRYDWRRRPPFASLAKMKMRTRAGY